MKSEMIQCKVCGISNLPGTNYCQNCGSFLKNHRGKFDFKYILNAGLGKGISIAPLAMQSIENGAKSNPDLQQVKKKTTVKVIPLSNGCWYCPDCGTYNKKFRFNGDGCGREFFAS